MKRMVLRAAFALLAIGFVTTVAACVNDPTTEAPTTQAPTTAATTQAPTTSATHYYLAGNFSGYVANDEAFLMEAVSGKPGWYQITVSLTADVRDNAYDGHYYKVTDGTWTRCWGTEKYALQPAPASPTGGGLGSIWIYENQDLIVLFDSVNLVIYDSSMVRELENPVIYGDFSNWSLSDENAVVLTQDDDESTLYSGTVTLPAYTGTDEAGYSLAVCLSEKYYIGAGYSLWGAFEQFLFDGSEALMGLVSHLKPEVETTYAFVYDSDTHVTTVTELLSGPIIYGDFSNWSMAEADAIHLVQDEVDEDLYHGTFLMPAYTGEGLGHMMAVAVTKQLYFWEGTGSWGAGEQYLFSGDAGGMGKVTYLNIDEAMELTFTYNKTTHQTTITPPTGKAVAPFELLAGPTLYGTFTRVDNDNQCFILEGEGAALMTPVSGEANLYEITLDLPVFTAPTSGYYTEDTGFRFLVVLTKSNVGWGYYAGEQYLFDGTPAGMGASTIITITEAGQYRFVYNALTHETTYQKVTG
ncbi:MAG: hypothetical protein PHO96_03620 [Candidatus Izemoplasmatales bacterium]|nr:hypothetical protein [Candidatus Izemoplasmatales bacterium]